MMRWGRYKPSCRFSGDQVPLPFIVGNSTTAEDKGTKAVPISQPSDGLEKRQAALHLTFRPVQMNAPPDIECFKIGNPPEGS
jgi:hypothetical protein